MKAISVVVAASLLAGASLAQAAEITDTFDSLGGLWTPFTSGADAGWAVQVDGQLRIAKAADPGGVNQGTMAGLRANFTIVGDFTMSVDYHLVDWPAPGKGYNLARVFIDDLGGNWAYLIGRHNYGSSTVYECTHFRGAVAGMIAEPRYPDNSRDGTFGLTRVGDTVTAWIDYGSGPIVFGSDSSGDFTDPATLRLTAYQEVRPTGYRSFSSLDVRYDNFHLQADAIIPEPATLLLLASGSLFTLGRYVRRRRRK